MGISSALPLTDASGRVISGHVDDDPTNNFNFPNGPGITLQGITTRIHVEDDVIDYAVGLTAFTRTHPKVSLGASPRATLGLIQASKAWALLTGRVYVVWIEVGENGVPGAIQGGGHYEDEYVKTRDGWRIGTRTFVPSRLGPRDVYDVTRAQNLGARKDK